MGPREEEQLRVEQRIQQEEPPSPGKQAAIGIIGVITILGLPVILEWAGGGKPWRQWG